MPTRDWLQSQTPAEFDDDYGNLVTDSMDSQTKKLAEATPFVDVRQNLYFYGVDPASQLDYCGIIIDCLKPQRFVAGKTWMPYLADLYRLQFKQYDQLLAFLFRNLFVKMPPTRLAVDITQNPYFGETLMKKLGETKVLHVKFSNAGNSNTKYEMKQLGYEYLQQGYKFPNPEVLQSQGLVKKAQLVRILQTEMKREQLKRTENNRITFNHPVGKHNDMVHAWELAKKALMNYQMTKVGMGIRPTRNVGGRGRHPLEIAMEKGGIVHERIDNLDPN